MWRHVSSGFKSVQILILMPFLCHVLQFRYPIPRRHSSLFRFCSLISFICHHAPWFVAVHIWIILQCMFIHRVKYYIWMFPWKISTAFKHVTSSSQDLVYWRDSSWRDIGIIVRSKTVSYINKHQIRKCNYSKIFLKFRNSSNLYKFFKKWQGKNRIDLKKKFDGKN